jgi:hypothetical protein
MATETERGVVNIAAVAQDIALMTFHRERALSISLVLVGGALLATGNEVLDAPSPP